MYIEAVGADAHLNAHGVQQCMREAYTSSMHGPGLQRVRWNEQVQGDVQATQALSNV